MRVIWLVKKEYKTRSAVFASDGNLVGIGREVVKVELLESGIVAASFALDRLQDFRAQTTGEFSPMPLGWCLWHCGLDCFIWRFTSRPIRCWRIAGST